MSKLSPYLIPLVLAFTMTFCGCGGGAPPPDPSSWQVVVFSDLHFNALYDRTLYAQLAASDPTQWDSIFQTSKITAPSSWGSDTNYPLLQLALTAIKQQASAGGPVLLFTGDLLGHGLPDLFYLGYCQTQKCSDPPGPEQTAAMQAFIDKTVLYVTSKVRAAAGQAPVLFAVGNIDSYSTDGPNTDFLTRNAATFYTQFLNGAIDQQAFLSTFTGGGYYSASLPGINVLFVSLDSDSFVSGWPGDPDAELAWLDSQLAAARAAGQKVWLLMHVPPGADTQETANNAAAAGTPNKVTATTTSMMWQASYQTTFLQTLQKYPGIVTFAFGGHTHMDEYRIVGGIVLSQSPSITPWFGNNPAFRLFTIKRDTWLPTDYQSFYFDLAAPPAQFNWLYTFSTTYGLYDNLPASFTQLYPRLTSDSTMQGTYMYLYNSANTTDNKLTKAPWDPVNDANWPIFACGISHMDMQGYMDCVNSY